MRSKRLCLFGNKLSLGCRGSSEAHGKVHLQPRSISSYPSKALPKQQQNPRWDENQQCDQDYNCGIAAGNNKQKEAKKWAMSEAEAVIVLKSVPARKRTGRFWCCGIVLQEWERPKPGRRPDIFPQFSPMKTPLPPPMPYDPPEEDEDEEEKKEEEEEEQEQEEESPEKIDPDKNNI
ncbi:hypothetical protein C1H46_014777 [Malus baccata]|uniref:Uncharacterized protein n=1 Tax=Malus baccata TaxID=106549 RepID=A0A540MLK8_MALBA|nr:hypothetical protein C1H46_014777 [Malus baccata]